MSQDPETEYVLRREKFTGHLVIHQQRVPIVLTASARRSGALDLDVEPIPAGGHSDILLALKHAVGRPGDPVDEGCLDCRSCDGKRLTSEQVYLTACSSGSKGTRIKIGAREASLAMPASESFPRPRMRFLLLGFKCHPLVQVETNHGRVMVQGMLQTSAFDHMTGWVAVEGPNASAPTGAWREAAEPLLEHLRAVLAFARGAPLPAPIREFCAEDTVHLTFCETSGGHAPMMPPLPHLDLQPLVAAAVTNIEAVDACREAFELAIGWLVAPTTYDEIRFLSGMIALESVMYRSLKRSQTSILRRSQADKFASHVRKLVDAQTFDDDTKEAIKVKIPELNRRSLVDTTEALLQDWRVARTGISRDALSELVKFRNKIAHQGATGQDLWPFVLLVREILVRLVLSMLQFKGNYWCYVDGRHMRRFPECERVYGS